MRVTNKKPKETGPSKKKIIWISYNPDGDNLFIGRVPVFLF
jgi:hypothetical protein